MARQIDTEALRARIRRHESRLYDSRTSERVRRDLSLTVSVLRARLGSMDIEKMAAASLETE